MASDPGTNIPQPLIDALVAAVDLVNIVDDAGTIGREGGDQQRYAGSNIWRAHFYTAQLRASFQTDHGSRCGSHKNDLGAHINEFVDKK